MNHTLGIHTQNGARPLRSHNPCTDVDELELMQACDIFHALFLSNIMLVRVSWYNNIIIIIHLRVFFGIWCGLLSCSINVYSGIMLCVGENVGVIYSNFRAL